MKIPLYLFTLFFFWCCVSKNDRQAMTDISGMREVVFDDKNTINIDSVIANYRFVRLDSTDNFPIGELWQTTKNRDRRRFREKSSFFRPGWKFHRKQKDFDNVFDARICLGRQSGRRNIQRESGRSRIARFQAYRQSNFIYGS